MNRRRVYSTEFSVEIFEHESADNPRLLEFTRVYVNNLAPDFRTDPRELQQFLRQSPPYRRITYLGFTQRRKPCGFATLMYYPEARLCVIDHIVIDRNYRTHGAFFTFCELIQSHIEEQQYEIDYFVVEIALQQSAADSAVDPRSLTRLLQMLGFRSAGVKYWAPDKSIVESTDSCRAVLMFRCQMERTSLSVEEFLAVCKTIYEKHYADWYRVTMSDEKYDEYRVAMTARWKAIELELSGRSRIILDGTSDSEISISEVVECSPSGERPHPIFVSYTHVDRGWVERLHTVLKPIIQDEKISFWEDSSIEPGGKWREKIEVAMAKADYAILMISPDFLASDFVIGYELPRLLELHRERGLRILWILLRDCLWRATPIADFQAVSPTERPLAEMRRAEQERALREIGERIGRIAAEG